MRERKCLIKPNSEKFNMQKTLNSKNNNNFVLKPLNKSNFGDIH